MVQMKSKPLQTLADVDAEVAALASSGIRIPPQPRIVMEIVEMLQAGQLDMSKMADVIAQDAGLTAMLYKTTRSVAYARRRPPQSLEQILVLLGLRQTALLVQSYGVTVALSGNNPLLEQFWARSLDIAQLASVIAHERVSVCNVFPEQAYMVGIFHDCGVPVLMQRFPDYCHATGVDGRARKWADVREEDRAFNVDHCSIGYLLARHWRLPDFVAGTILNHHEFAYISHAARTMVAILQLAIQLHSEDQGLPNPDWHKARELVLDELGVHPDDLDEFCDTVTDRRRELD